MTMLKGVQIFLGITLGATLIWFGNPEGWAQETRNLSYKWSAGSTKYTRQYVIEVEDIPGHEVRVYEIHRTWPKDPPTFDDVRVKEEWLRGYSDYINTNGHSAGYHSYVLENGDKIFGRLDGTSQTIVNPDGSKKSTFTGVITLTGGTGKFRGIRGVARYSAIFNPKANLNEGQVEGKYWIAE